MGEILLETLRDRLGGAMPVDAVLTARASLVRVDGDKVTVPAPVRVHIRGGVPATPVVLQASGPDWYWTLRLQFANISRPLVRHVIVPEGQVEWASLVDVDPDTYQPVDPTPALLDTIDRQVAAYMVEHPAGGVQVTNHGAQAGSVTLAAGTNTITLTGDVSLTVPALADGAELTVFVQQDGTGGHGLSWGGVVWQSGDGQPATDADVISTFLLIGSVFGTLGYTAGSGTGGGGGDTTPPVPGTLTASSITQTGFSLAVSGASDDTALHAAPYRFTTNGGTTWSAWQSSALYAASGLTAATVYQCQHEVRDAAGNVASGTVVPVTTGAAAANLAVTFLGSFGVDGTQSTYTYANAPLGTASGSRRIIIGFSCRGTTAPTTIPSVTVGGVAAARITQAGTPGIAANGLWLYVADIPTGTSADIVVTLSAAALRAGIGVWSTDVPVAFVSQDHVPAAPGTSWSMTSAATTAQAVVGLAITSGAAPTLTPAVDGSHVLGASSFHAWHENGAGRTQQISGMLSSVGQGLQVTLGAA